MPDIFGREESNYKLLMAMDKKKILDSNIKQLKMRGLVHNFDALPSPHDPVKMSLNDIEASAQAFGFVTNNFQAIQAMVEEILYTDFRLDNYFPMVTTIPEGARTYSYKVINVYGQGKFIDNSGKDANRASASMQNVPYALEYAGIIPSWNLEDIRGAAFAGIPLDTHTIQAGTDGCLDHIEQIGLKGDAGRGFTGLVNQPDIPADSSAKTIANMSADEMVTFIQTGVADIIEQTAEVMGTRIKSGMVIYVPISQQALLLHTRLATDASKTVWEYVSINNLWTARTGETLKLEGVAEMSGAGAGATDRSLFGFNNNRIMEMAMPIQPRVIRLLDQHYGVDAPMEYKISGLNVKRPTAMRYYDAI